MKKVVVMPGGFHPFHAGHKSLYDAAVKAFPDADVYVAATDDTSQRPFPFQTKQWLARLAGIPADKFVQVKSPFQAREVTSRYQDQADDTALIFVRSDKDKNERPQPGGVKKDGSPAYLQPLTKDLKPMTQHGYVAYLPTVKFADGLTSATEIRQSWPDMEYNAKINLVNVMYPATKQNQRLAQQAVQAIDKGIMGTGIEEARLRNDPESGAIIYPDGGLGGYSASGLQRAVAEHLAQAVQFLKAGEFDKVEYILYQWGVVENKVRALKQYLEFMKRQGRRPMASGKEVDLGEDYVEEKWSQKYKRSINCDSPKGFSQRAHCAGRKK